MLMGACAKRLGYEAESVAETFVSDFASSSLCLTTALDLIHMATEKCAKSSGLYLKINFF